MTLFMVIGPVILPFFVRSLVKGGLPDTLSWWKALGAGVAAFFFYLLFSWLLSFPKGMLPSFQRDLLVWGLHDFAAMGLAALVGLRLFQSDFFVPFLTNRTIFPFVMGIYLPSGIDSIVRYVHIRDAYILFGLPVLEFSFLLSVALIFSRALDAEGSRRLLMLLLIVPAAFLAALVPALYYSFYPLAAFSLLFFAAALTVWLSYREGLLR